MKFARKWVDSESIIWSEVTQTQRKTIACSLSYNDARFNIYMCAFVNRGKWILPVGRKEAVDWGREVLRKGVSEWEGQTVVPETEEATGRERYIQGEFGRRTKSQFCLKMPEWILILCMLMSTTAGEEGSGRRGGTLLNWWLRLAATAK